MRLLVRVSKSRDISGEGVAAVTLDVVDVPERSRYEVLRNGKVLGFSGYQRAEGLIVFTHSEVDPALEGQGIGAALVRGAWDDVRGQGLPVLPICPFVQSWMARHPDYADLDYWQPPAG